jgi:hypothetical protein
VEAKPEFKGLPVLIHVAAQHPLERTGCQVLRDGEGTRR